MGAAVRELATAPILWAAQPGPQRAFIACPCLEVVYGGARGGGKTDACFGDWLGHQLDHGQYAKGLFLRRELPQLEAAIQRSKELFFKIGAEWKEQAKTWVFRNGATLKFRPLEREDDAEKYQGHDYTRLYPEELTNWPTSKPILRMLATLRSARGVPVGMRATCNPGGPGHSWVKARYIDNGPYKIVREGSADRVFIPARIADNPALLKSDPGYIDRLKQSGSETLVRAWLNGDWNVVEGAFFPEWRDDVHIIRPFEIPQHWSRIRGFDWGSAAPFSVGWWAVASETTVRPEGLIPRGALIRYREWYGASSPNVGLKLTAEQVADGIKEREAKGETIALSIADPAIFAENGGPSLAERMGDRGVYWSPGDNKRVAQVGAMGGWDQVRARLVGMDGRPMLYSFNTCPAFNRTIPALQHDSLRPEDVDTDGEDHAADEGRYVCMSRPWTAPQPEVEKPRDYKHRRDRSVDSWRTV